MKRLQVFFKPRYVYSQDLKNGYMA